VGLDTFVEFDGGDGQMDVAGDGDSGKLEDIGDGSQATVVEKTIQNIAGYKPTKSRERSANVALGTSTGYADKLRESGKFDTARAQQLENWQNQNELNRKRKDSRDESGEFGGGDTPGEGNTDEDWRKLSSFGVERKQDFNLEEEFGE